jgi:elongation factor P
VSVARRQAFPDFAPRALRERTFMDTSDIRKGVKMMYEGQPYIVVDFQFVKPGKGQAFTRTKLKNLLTGSTLERNIRSGEKFELADVEDRTLQYIYPDGEMYVFMSSVSGDQMSVHKDIVADAADFLIDGIEVQITIYKGNPVSVSLPPHIVVQITETEPGIKGDTATNVSKPAKISTGATVPVPLFVNEGDWIKVDTRSRSYLERSKAP